MRTVIKERLNMGRTIVMVNEGAKLLHVGAQRSTINIWFEADVSQRQIDRTFYIVGTGHPVPPNMEYRGTVMMGEYVWHVYEQM